ncbi:hypothetical protein [Clostridium sp.]|jgi:hypothetical protein|uniref:hypothetical protein n=3 Tax=Clostridium TaxID=1485 RepID=UPI0025C1FECC|nr:hypothetical protein [Clostridium sp.]MCI9304138.1 hypothetical protein [Clostridium sp.]
MKKYLKYKEFIPKEFVEKKQLQEKEESKRIYKVLILINLILLLFNMDSISKEEKNEKTTTEITENFIEKEEIFKWINLYNEDSIDFKVTDNFAEITYEKNKNINNLEKLGVKINKVTSYDDKKVVKVMYE